MKTEKDYKGFPDIKQKEEAALKDIKEYLGEEKFNKITVAVLEDAKDNNVAASFEYFTNACGLLLGIEGYPVKVWYQFIFRKENGNV